MEATALTFNMHFIDIYVCSWGPRDDGAEIDGPHRLTARALRLGTHEARLSSPRSHCCLSDGEQSFTLSGRGGKGSVFVWASGNGGMQLDHCGADGYVNSIYTIAIGAVTQTGKPAHFGEPCPGVMAVTLTGASVGSPLPLVTVTSVGGSCVTHFPGTSSAAPIAAGILALVLEVNPELTWRDVQHLIANTAQIPDPKEPGWNINAAGYHVHHSDYGTVLLEADQHTDPELSSTGHKGRETASVQYSRQSGAEIKRFSSRSLSPGSASLSIWPQKASSASPGL
nr:PREDICTED: PC3-like endoprotease variant B [Notothenia coriiceps]